MVQDFLSFVHSSHLPEEDKQLWEEAVALMTPEALQEFTGLLDGSEEELKLLTENVKQKKQAILDDDIDLVQEILRQEEAAIAT